jgi:hypothetical protein
MTLNSRQLDSCKVRRLVRYLLNDIRRHVQARSVGWEVVEEDGYLCSVVSQWWVQAVSPFAVAILLCAIGDLQVKHCRRHSSTAQSDLGRLPSSLRSRLEG